MPSDKTMDYFRSKIFNWSYKVQTNFRKYFTTFFLCLLTFCHRRSFGTLCYCTFFLDECFTLIYRRVLQSDEREHEAWLIFYRLWRCKHSDSFVQFKNLIKWQFLSVFTFWNLLCYCFGFENVLNWNWK